MSIEAKKLIVETSEEDGFGMGQKPEYHPPYASMPARLILDKFLRKNSRAVRALHALTNCVRHPNFSEEQILSLEKTIAESQGMVKSYAVLVHINSDGEERGHCGKDFKNEWINSGKPYVRGCHFTPTIDGQNWDILLKSKGDSPAFDSMSYEEKCELVINWALRLDRRPTGTPLKPDEEERGYAAFVTEVDEVDNKHRINVVISYPYTHRQFNDEDLDEVVRLAEQNLKIPVTAQ